MVEAGSILPPSLVRTQCSLTKGRGPPDMDAEAMLKTFVVALLEGSILSLAKINPVELPILIRPSDDRERIPLSAGDFNPIRTAAS
jgi:hypothetical protein